MSEPTLPPYPDTRRRWLIAAIVLFFVAIQYAGSAADRQARVREAFIVIGASLLCLSRFFWVYFEVAKRRRVDWRFKRYTGPWVLRIAYPLAALAIFLALFGAAFIAAWLTAWFNNYFSIS